MPAERRPGPCVVETVEFMVAPGRYRLEAAVRNPVTGRETRSAVDLEGLGGRTEERKAEFLFGE